MSTINKNKPVIDSGLCRCCGNTKKCRLLNVEYEWLGRIEVYSDMFVDCFGLVLSHLDVEPAERLVCATCVTRLRDACAFRQQVLQCEQKLLQTKIMVHGDEDNKVKEEIVIKHELTEYSEHRSDEDHFSADGDDGGELINDDNNGIVEVKTEAPLVGKATTNKTRLKTKSAGTKRKVVKKGSDEHLMAKREMLLRMKKMSEKLKMMAGGKLPHLKPPQLNPPKLKPPQPILPKFVDKEMNTIHNTLVIVENSYVCPFINTFSDYNCLYCKELFTDPDKLREHTLTHDPSAYKDVILENKKIPQIDIVRIDCRLCQKRIDDIEVFKSHITTAHGKKIHTEVDNEFLKFRLKTGTLNCTECDSPFGYFHRLKRHMAEHFGTHICDICGAHYFDQHGLLMHQRTHEEKQNNFPCDQCGRVFKSKPGMKYHISHMHSKPSYPCYKCDEVLFSYAKRYRHMIEVHGEHRTFPCESCDRVYDSRKGLREHNRRSHLKVLRHECTVCDKKFYQPSALKDHMTSHTGERNYRCEYCGKTYPRLRALKVHLQSHDSEKRYKCNLCTAAYTQANNLKNHLKTKHQGYDVKDDIE